MDVRLSLLSSLELRCAGSSDCGVCVCVSGPYGLCSIRPMRLMYS
jgi:hypothetical protein